MHGLFGSLPPAASKQSHSPLELFPIMASALWSSKQLSGQEAKLLRQLWALYEKLHEAAHDGPANRADHFHGLIQEARLLVEALPSCQAVMGAGVERQGHPQVSNGLALSVI